MNDCNYGFIFNDINIIDNNFVKKAKNLLGLFKINNEINFYLYIKINKISFNMPKLISYYDGEIIIEFINNATTLTNKINRSNLDYFLNIIKTQMNNLHYNRIEITQDILKKDLYIETQKKILDRFNEFDWYSNNIYNSIHYVNNVKINNINYYCNLIHNKLLNYLKERNNYNLIHGDIHLGNILIDEKENIFFIDPRGYFGETKLFGLFEYDYAKLLFGLSGYSYFDNLKIETLEILDGNLNINFIKDYEYIFIDNKFDNITNLLCLSIWLGNNNCFIDVNKKITSLMIAYYYCEKYL